MTIYFQKNTANDPADICRRIIVVSTCFIISNAQFKYKRSTKFEVENTRFEPSYPIWLFIWLV